jgi:hypothetical protein
VSWKQLNLWRPAGEAGKNVYKIEGNKSRLIQSSSGWIKGDQYKPSGDCAECCVPWEVCTWPCPDEILDK